MSTGQRARGTSEESLVHRRTPVSGSLPLDPPPFYLDREIRLAFRPGDACSLAVAVFVCGLYGTVVWAGDQPLPSLISLVLVSLGSAGAYLTIHHLVYILIWFRALRKYQEVRGIHPAARGELPRNAFAVVLCAPFLGIAAFLGGLVTLGLGLRPLVWMGAAVTMGLFVRDLEALWHLSGVERGAWITQSTTGLDILKPVDRERLSDPEPYLPSTRRFPD